MSNSLFQRNTASGQLILLFGLFVSAYVLALILLSAVSIMMGTTDLFSASSGQLKFIQALQTFVLFALPAVLMHHLYRHSEPPLFEWVNKPHPLHLLMAGVMMICIQPSVNVLSYFNKMLTLPEALSGIENFIRTTEEATEKLMGLLMADTSVSGYITAILVIAILVAVCEELLFRGVLQPILQKLTKNVHIAVWLTAIIFSLIHFQFYGFLPRMVLGALLGYIFVWSKSLIPSIIAHFVNNWFAVTMYYLFSGTPSYEQIEAIGTGNTWSFALFGLLAIVIMAMVFPQVTNCSKKQPE